MTTQHANATYQEIIDLHTEEDTVSVIGIHTPSTRLPIAMLSGFWRQFNKFRYNGCSLSMVPAARLPTDPLQVEFEGGAATIDPRDNLNPILFHGCHGQDMGLILNQFYETGNLSLMNASQSALSASTINSGVTGGVVRFPNTQSADITTTSSTSVEQNEQSTNRVGDVQLESLYYRALTDQTWRKSNPQSGLKIRGLHPLVYNVATTRSLGNSGVTSTNFSGDVDIGSYDGVSRTATGNNAGAPISSTPSDSAGSRRDNYAGSGDSDALVTKQVQGPQMTNTGSSPSVSFSPVYDTPLYTPSTRRLGWMDTRLRDTNTNFTVTGLNGQFANDSTRLSTRFTESYENYATVPKIYMGMLLMPRAYRVEQYFRLILTHSFSFSGFRGQSMTTEFPGDVTSAPGYFNFN